MTKTRRRLIRQEAVGKIGRQLIFRSGKLLIFHRERAVVKDD